MWGILGFLGKFAGFLLDRFWPSKDRELGRAEAEREGLKANVQQVKKASAAVDAVRTDSSKLAKLRDRFRKAK